ncbi:hypothetical protein QGM71_00345 [Virgibacillus sp. C22-A2]|uniref:Uncharacterized protein n=1 Tax=Virgibacillus tibetensis TaxID=3042313 RepID=A0ABU6K985_9BACI|nr:hypothetical protein [Virgibacillus sp. C22-A2]
MIKQWNKKYLLISGGIIITVLLIYGISYFNIVKPMQDEAKALSKEADMYEGQYNKVTGESANEVEDKSLEDAALNVPNEKSPDNVLVNLQKLANSANVTIEYIESIVQGVDEDQQEDEDSLSVIKESMYSLDVTAANLDEATTFLIKMLNSERMIVIDTMNIQQSEEQVFLSITFTTFYAG